MSDRPTTPPAGAPDPQRPEQVSPPAVPPTASMPQAAQHPAGPPGAPAPPPPSGPGGPRRLWGEATSTGGGRAALVVAAILGTLLLVTGVGLAAALIGGSDWGRDEWVGMGDRRGQGPGGDDGPGRGRDRGNGMGMGNWGQGGPQRDLDDGPGPGRGGGLAGAADVLHGEFTTGVTGTPTVMVVQTGVVTAYTAGTSLEVESADGFRATYSLDGALATPRNVAVATGSQVRVVAAKSGMTVTRLVVLR